MLEIEIIKLFADEAVITQIQELDQRQNGLRV